MVFGKGVTVWLLFSQFVHDYWVRLGPTSLPTATGLFRVGSLLFACTGKVRKLWGGMSDEVMAWFLEAEDDDDACYSCHSFADSVI